MSTSLKMRYADEIAAAMSQTLENKDFMNQFTKTAALSHEDEVRQAIAQGEKTQCVGLYNTYFGGGESDSALQLELNDKYGEDGAIKVTNELRGNLYKICNPGPGESVPPMNANDDECPECGDAEAPQLDVAVGFAMEHLVKVADALDGRGFSVIAGIIDEALEKLASKKPPKMGYAGWVKKLKKMEGPVEKFEEAYAKALEYGKNKKNMKKKEAEEYALRTALGKLPKKFVVDKPTK